MLSLIDPLVPDLTQHREITIPKDNAYIISGAIPNLTGEWIGLPFQSMQGHKFQLYNSISETILDVAQANFSVGDISGLSDQHFAWSPNGKFLAFAVSQPVENSEVGNGVYIYSVDEQRIVPLMKDVSNEARLAWSPDSKAIVIRKRSCPTMESCDYSLVILDPVAGTEIKTLQISTLLPELNFRQGSFIGVDTICDIDWSPDGRYISFIPLCSYEPTPLLKEVYAWDTLQDEMFPVTNFTTANQFQSPTAVYRKIWVTPNTLLIGAAWNEDLKAEIKTKTVAIHLPDKNEIEISPSYVEAWAINPISSELAYRLVDAVEAADMSVKTTRLHIGTLTISDSKATTLTSKLTISKNACRLSWSPDGSILAFTEQAENTTIGQTCTLSPINVSFLDPITGRISVFQLEPNTPPNSTIIVGWVPIE
jgi:Tol biopolymer transport system component